MSNSHDQPSTSNMDEPARAEPQQGNRQRLNQTCIQHLDGVQKINSAFKNRICSYRFSTKQYYLDHNEFFENVKDKVKSIVQEYIDKFLALKINFELFSLYAKPETDASDTKSFNTRNMVVTQSDNLDDIVDLFKVEIITKAGNFQERDSGKLWKEYIFIKKLLYPYYRLGSTTDIVFGCQYKQICPAVRKFVYGITKRHQKEESSFKYHQ